MMKKTIITLVLALSVIMADEPGCLNDYDANESIKVSFDILIDIPHCFPQQSCSESYERASECDESFKQACDKGKDKSGKFCYAAGLSLLADAYGSSPEKYLKKACEKNKDYCDYEEKIYKAKIDSVEGEDYDYLIKGSAASSFSLFKRRGDYEAYLTKGSIAFNAKKYKQAENYFRKGCEKAVSYEGTSVFDDFYQNCNAHTAMELFAKACEHNPSPKSINSIWGLDKSISCMQIGDIYYKGNKELQVKRNIPLAKNFYKKACENPKIYEEIRGVHETYTFSYLNCKELGNLYYSENNFVEAKKWWTKAIIGTYYFRGVVMGDLKCSETDTIKGICEKNGIRSYISIEGYFQEAEKYYNAVKEREYDYKTGNWIEIPYKKDYNKAFILASIGCDDFADSKSCHLLAKAYTEGKGTKQDSNLAQHYHKKGNKCEAQKLLNEYRQNIELDYRYENKTGLLEEACKLDSESEACTDLKEKRYYEPEGTK